MRFFIRLITALFIVGVGFACMLLIFGPRQNVGEFPHSPREQGEIQQQLEPQLESNH